jgi:hypothetical protein
MTAYHNELYGQLSVLLLKDAVSSTQAKVCSVRRLLVTANVVPSSLILVTLMKEALGSSEMSVLTRATRRNIPEYAILHSKNKQTKQTPWPLVRERTSP